MRRAGRIKSGDGSQICPRPDYEPGAHCKGSLLFILFIVLPAFPAFSGAATITVQTDRNPAVLQESFQLLFEAVGKVDGDPDFSPLEKDFQVLSTSTSSSMSIVNTNITRTTQWRLNLLPLKSGSLTIPAISFGKDKSPETSLRVELGRSGLTGQDARDIFIEVEAAPESAYVQAEVVYTVKLYRSVATSNETLSEPAVSQGSAIVEQLDADRSYDILIKGRRYAVFERSYGIYPQVSGSLVIPPVRFQARLASTSIFSLDPFGGGTKTVVRQSEPVELQVEPIPAAYRGGHWLPATDVKITEEWSKNPLELLPDEPVTRTLTLTAQGLTSSQLPEIPELLPGGFKQYPDMPVLENTKSADGITAARQQKNAIIPAQAGNYTLPEVSLPWWNTDTQTLEYAVLPERQVQVATVVTEPPGNNMQGQGAIGAPDLPLPDIDAGDIAKSVPEPVDTAAVGDTVSADVSVWQWLTGILAAAWVITLVYILKKRKAGRPEAEQAQNGRLNEAVKNLKRACRDNDPQRAKTALLQWAGAHPSGPTAASLGDLEQHSGGELAAEIRTLSRRLYSRKAEAWSGEPLWQAFVNDSKTTRSAASRTRGELEPLFKL